MGNYEYTECEFCGNSFKRATKRIKGRGLSSRSNAIRPINRVTCSDRCAREMRRIR